jgi:hypothetical protein
LIPSVGVLPSIGHAQEERLLMFELKILVLELFSIDRFSTYYYSPPRNCKPVPFPAVKSPPTISARTGAINLES